MEQDGVPAFEVRPQRGGVRRGKMRENSGSMCKKKKRISNLQDIEGNSTPDLINIVTEFLY